MYVSFPGTLNDIKCLSALSNFLTNENVRFFMKEGQALDRREMDGLITLEGTIGRARVGVIWTDFRVGGGSFGGENSPRLSKFVQYLARQNMPLVFFINSLGARFMSSRTLFDNAFGVLPDLYNFSKTNLFVGVSLGKTLGLSALFFTQAHYRLAIEENTQINLTGPEVHKKFFGNVDAPFESYTTAEHQFATTSLVHEILGSTNLLIERVRNLIAFNFDSEISSTTLSLGHTEVEQGALLLTRTTDESLAELKMSLADEMLEIFSQRSSVVRTYIGKMANGRRIGFFVNPPGHPNNLLTVNAVDKCLAALKIFKVLGLPVVSVLDCPGGDPRKKESDKDVLVKMIELCHAMIDYPFRKMGIVKGRCFGGAGMFAFPKIFGGIRNVAVEGSQFGVMHKSIIAELLSGSPTLLNAWEKIAETETADLGDLISCGTLDAIISKNDIRREIENFLDSENSVAGNAKNANLAAN